MYNKKLIENFDSINNYGLLKGYNASSAFVCEKTGDVVKPYFIIKDNVIVDSKFKAFGSMETIVVASICMEYIIGKTLIEAKNLTPIMIAKYLPNIDNDFYSIKLCFDAIAFTVEEYEKKIEKLAKKQEK